MAASFVEKDCILDAKMVKNLMEDKKLDFDAPLLSVRRLSAEAAAAAASSSSTVPPAYGSGESGTKPPPRRFSLPFYRSELKSGPVCNPGVVPFVWEQTPGQPKSGGGRRPTDKELHSSREATAPPAKLGSSVRTHKAAAFHPSEGAAASPEAAKEKDLKAVNRSQQQPTQAPDNTNNNDDDDDDDVFMDAPDALSRTESFLMNCSVSGLSSFREHLEPSSRASREPQVQDFMMARFLPAAQALASGSPQYTFRKAATPAREPTRATDRLMSENLRRSPLLLHHRRPSHSTDDDGEEDDDDDYDDHGRTPSGACGLLPKFSLKSSLCLFNPFPGMKHRGRHLPPPRRREIHRPQIKNSSQGEDEGTKLTSKSNQFTRRGDYSPTARRSIGGAVSPYRYEAPPSPFREGRGFLGVPGKESNSSNIDDGSRLDLKKTHADVAHHPEAEDSDMNSVQSPLPLLPPQSPSESWLLHTLPSVSSKKNPTAWSFLGLGFQPREQALTHLEQRTNTKPSKPQRRHARFAAVFILLL
ncbi:hypothetical protein BHM03_00019591 [Ensete ventricosum]|nr:hypothetical protein BHM03_00019591 [Ensete ventricosum]